MELEVSLLCRRVMCVSRRHRKKRKQPPAHSRGQEREVLKEVLTTVEVYVEDQIMLQSF